MNRATPQSTLAVPPAGPVAGRVDDLLEVSLVIPTYNEEASLPKTLRAIHAALRNRCRFEVVVVDHGSSDDTVRVALNNDVKVIERPDARTIAELRNEGAAVAQGAVLVFLDADITVSPEWGARLRSTFQQLRRTGLLVTGSVPELPSDAGCIARAWFQRCSGNLSHLGSAHLIVTSETFAAIGGFATEMETGEDYNLCARVVAAGGTIQPDHELRVVHEGTPRTLPEFFRREVWHGRGDLVSLKAAANSLVSITAAVFTLSHVAIGFAPLLGWTALWFGAAAVLAICVGSAARRCWRGGVSVVVVNSSAYYVYYAARSLSMASVLVRPDVQKRTRRNMSRSTARGGADS